MPDGGRADVSVKPDELKALKPRLESLIRAIRALGKHLGENPTNAVSFGRTPEGAEAGGFFCEHRGILADTKRPELFLKALAEAIAAAAEGHEENETNLSHTLNNVGRGE